MRPTFALEHFRFSPNRGNALSPCFHAIPGKSVSRFAWQNRYTLLLELLQWFKIFDRTINANNLLLQNACSTYG
jgi:hypothetical protein